MTTLYWYTGRKTGRIFFENWVVKEEKGLRFAFYNIRKEGIPEVTDTGIISNN